MRLIAPVAASLMESARMGLALGLTTAASGMSVLRESALSYGKRLSGRWQASCRPSTGLIKLPRRYTDRRNPEQLQSYESIERKRSEQKSNP